MRIGILYRWWVRLGEIWEIKGADIFISEEAFGKKVEGNERDEVKNGAIDSCNQYIFRIERLRLPLATLTSQISLLNNS